MTRMCCPFTSRNVPPEGTKQKKRRPESEKGAARVEGRLGWRGRLRGGFENGRVDIRIPFVQRARGRKI
ncbi:hypothetical protein HanLR1_Chr12g0433721 [Helianthus annuus]|nr:hypothetical protein HanHA89_Chr12g0456291 [Helianthus annuus]KAJ0673870.1 hypothetical protein HanLR1_Chr12g0433721 [Helianthus annuus]